jgi:Flp pilus assembly protein TadB
MQALAVQRPSGTGENIMGLLKGLGVFLIIAWLVLWLAVKITFAAIHLLLLIGLALLVYGFINKSKA